MVEVERLLKQWREILRVIPSLECRPRMLDALEVEEIVIDRERWALLVAIDGRRTVRELVQRSARPVIDVCHVLLELVEAGAIGVIDPAASRAPEPEPELDRIQEPPVLEAAFPEPEPAPITREPEPAWEREPEPVAAAPAEPEPVIQHVPEPEREPEPVPVPQLDSSHQSAPEPAPVPAAERAPDVAPEPQDRARSSGCSPACASPDLTQSDIDVQHCARSVDNPSRIPTTPRMGCMDREKGAPVGDATPLGALLIDEGLLTDAQLDAALAEQARSGQAPRPAPDRVGQHLRGRVGAHAGPPGRASSSSTSTTARSTLRSPSLVTESLARRYQAIPIGWEDGRLVVAMADPSNVFAVDDIRAIAGAEVRTVVATAGADQRAPSNASTGIDSDVDAVVQAATEDADDEADLSNVSEVVEDAPIVKFVNLLVTPGRRRPRVRHPRRARRARPAHPVPHRRRAARGDAVAAKHPGGRDQPPEGHGRHQHRRAPRSPRTAASP